MHVPSVHRTRRRRHCRRSADSACRRAIRVRDGRSCIEREIGGHRDRCRILGATARITRSCGNYGAAASRHRQAQRYVPRVGSSDAAAVAVVERPVGADRCLTSPPTTRRARRCAEVAAGARVERHARAPVAPTGPDTGSAPGAELPPPAQRRRGARARDRAPDAARVDGQRAGSVGGERRERQVADYGVVELSSTIVRAPVTQRNAESGRALRSCSIAVVAAASSIPAHA